MGGLWIHLKFESDSITERDLRRFREYEAYIGMIYKVPAATSVLCTSIEISERICRGMDILESPGLDMKEEDVKRMQSVLYVLAVKFLDRNQLMEVKEKIGMTILGQMLFEDGEKKGMEQGEERLSRLTLLLMNEKRYDDVEKVLKDKEYRSKMFKSMGV